MTKNKASAIEALLLAVLMIAVFYAVIAGVASRVRHPEWSETQHLIYIIYWGYEGE